MSQWGQGYGGQQGRPQQQWGPPTQQWGPPTQQWGQPTQQWGAQQQSWGAVSSPNRYQPRSRPPRRGGSALRTLVIVIGVIVLGMVVVSLLTEPETGDPSPQTPPGEYQNESYQVPPIDTDPPELPMPETYGEATDWMVNNAIYSSEIAVPVRCEAQPIDLANASMSVLQDHMNEFTGCLMRVFGPAVEQAGYVAVRPSVTIYTSEVQTRCGSMPRQNAAYCAADQQVYYAADLPAIIPYQLQGSPYVVESVVAHEFAHAIQARTGILISEAAWEQNSGEADANAFSRRLEVQADCWSGQFINPVGTSVGLDDNDVQQLSLLFYSIGDDQLSGDPSIEGNHGHGDSRRSWFLEGIGTTSMGACNTFDAPAAAVR